MSQDKKFRTPSDSKTDRLISFLVEQLLPADALQQLQKGRVKKEHLEPFARSLKSVSGNYTNHAVGEELGPSVNSEKEAYGYSLYYLPINFVKIDSLLAKCSLSSGYSVLDYGSGPATGALSCLFQEDCKPGEVTCVDHSPHMRKVAHTLLSAKSTENPSLKVRVVESLDRLDKAQNFDLIIAANVLAEMEEVAGDELVQVLLSRLHPNGSLLLVEPGQPQHTRRLMKIRDKVATFGSFDPVFPCTRCDKCPMLRGSKEDWCHGTIAWERPLFIQQLDELLEFNKHRLKYSGFIFKHATTPSPRKNYYRVIAPGIRSKKGIEATLCGPDFFGEVRLKPTERSDFNRPLERSSSFDLLEFDVPVSKELPPSTKVKLIK